MGNANCVCQLASPWASLQHTVKRGKAEIGDLEVDVGRSHKGASQRSMSVTLKTRTCFNLHDEICIQKNN